MKPSALATGLGFSLLTLAAAAPAPPIPIWTDRLPAASGTNLIPNSSFELGSNGWSTQGEVAGWGGAFSSLFGAVTDREKFEGNRSLEVSLGPGRTPSMSYDCWPAATVVQHAPLAVNLGWIPTIRGATYTLSAHLKADRAGTPARLVVRFGGETADQSRAPDFEKEVTLSTEWKRYSVTLPINDGSVCIGVGPDLRKQPDANATVWIDAVQFEKNAAPTQFTARAPLEIFVQTGKFGNVFSSGETVEVEIVAQNRSAVARDLEVAGTLTDYFDQPLPSFAPRIHVPAGASVSQRVPLRVPGPGYYKLNLTQTDTSILPQAPISLAVIHDYRRHDSAFGVNHAPPNRELLDQFRRAGVMWARDWALDWHQVEPQQDRFDWAEADRQTKRVHEAGWHIMSLAPAFSATRWASELPENSTVDPKRWHGNGSWAWLAAAPRDPADLADYIGHTVNRYKDRIHTWEFLNEPGTATALPAPSRGVPGYTYDAQDYIDLLRVASTTVRRADPKAKLVGGFSLEVLHRAPHFIRAGGLDLIDVFNIHPYELFEEHAEDFIPQMERLLALMDASKSGRKPIWVTETGFYAHDEKPKKPWIEPHPDFAIATERIAADQATRHAIIMFAHGVEKIFYHQGTEGDVNDPTRVRGNHLLASRGTPKKTYTTQAYLAHLFGTDFRFAGKMAKAKRLNGVPTDAVYGYAFQCGNRAVLAAWAPSRWHRGITWSLKIPRDVDAHNIVGTKLSDGGNGRSVTLGDSVVYLVTDLMTAADLAGGQLLRVSLRPEAGPASPITTF